MLKSIRDPGIQRVIDEARGAHATRAANAPYPSPEDWRDCWIYFLMIDRFNNTLRAPHTLPFDAIVEDFQGGTFAGVTAELSYIKQLGAGAIWITPPLRNLVFDMKKYHGYGIHHFLHADTRFAQNPGQADQELRALVDSAHAAGLYVIFDIVLNHTGNAFAYQCAPNDSVCVNSRGAKAQWTDSGYEIRWREAGGSPRQDWPVIEQIGNPPEDALVWPTELQQNHYFRRQGLPRSGGDPTIGDFDDLKQILTNNTDVQQALIRSYQYIVARFDIDGLRIDTLKYIDRDFARLFGNAIREFALVIGKKNFLTFGEVYGSEEEIARFIGRNATTPGDLTGVDAALDFPLFYVLPRMVKALSPPSSVVEMYANRKHIEAPIISSHGEATKYFVTFLDNHDQHNRFYYSPAATPNRFDDEVTVGLAILFSLQGIPCIYYGTEQGLHGSGGSPEAVREALWGKQNAFNQTSPFYVALQKLSLLRNQEPALRYGRQYFRPISGDGVHFAVSPFNGGVLAFSRILYDQEVVIIANTDHNQGRSVYVIVDMHLVKPTNWMVLYSNKPNPMLPAATQQRLAGTVTINEVDGSTGTGPVNILPVTLQPLEVQVLKQA